MIWLANWGVFEKKETSKSKILVEMDFLTKSFENKGFWWKTKT